MSDRHFIDDDGYTKPFKIDGVPGLHPPLSGRFRPAMPEKRFGYILKKEAEGKGYTKRLAQLLAEHIREWDATEKDGSPANITVARVSAMHPELLVKLESHVLGYEAAEIEEAEKN